MRNTWIALTATALLTFAAGCGGEDEPAPFPEGSLKARLAAQPGEDVGLVLGTSVFTVGENRISFLVVGNDGALVEAPTAKLYVARSLEGRPIATGTAQRRSLDPHGEGRHTQEHAEPNSEALFVTRLDFPKPGKYWFVVDLPGKPTQGIGLVDVKAASPVPAVGEKAIPSDNPTLADAPAREISTARPPAKELLRSSIRDAIEARVPFVVVFATPAYCSSRTCGPTVEIVEEARRRLAPTTTRFIHVEVYEGNDPANGVNAFMKEWKLPTEPWIFVVDSSGTIRARFEGSASLEELEQAVRSVS